jgi:hypothetical protein
MNFAIVVMQTRDAVTDALCERACEFARELPHAESARLESRSVTPEGTVLSVQRWRARGRVPALLRPHLEDGLLEWTLRLERPLGGYRCAWSARCAAVQVPGRCDGTMAFLSAAGGRGTCIEVRCEVVAGNEGLRMIFGSLVANHWRGLAAAGARWIATNRQAS